MLQMGFPIDCVLVNRADSIVALHYSLPSSTNTDCQSIHTKKGSSSGTKNLTHSHNQSLSSMKEQRSIQQVKYMCMCTVETNLSRM